MSATDIAATRAPAAAGVNVTEMVQVAPTARVAPQVVAVAKALLFEPVRAMLEMVSVAVPGLLSVTTCAELVVLGSWLANVSDVGVRRARGAGGTVPVPLSGADCGEPEALSATEIAPVKLAAESGTKVAEMVQLAEAASVAPQVVVLAKSAGFAPASEMTIPVRDALPVLVSVNVWATDALPTLVLGKLRLEGLRLAIGAGTAVPEPFKVAVCGEFEELSTTESVAAKLAIDAGVKVIEMVQLAEAARVVPQVLVCVKSAGLAPAMEIVIPVNGAVPVFDNVTVVATLIVFTV